MALLISQTHLHTLMLLDLTIVYIIYNKVVKYNEN